MNLAISRWEANIFKLKHSTLRCHLIIPQVIQHWVDTWTANTTQDEFKEVLEALCQKLDRPNRSVVCKSTEFKKDLISQFSYSFVSFCRVQHCMHIVDDYYIPWFNFLLHEVNPQLICSMVGLCGSGNSGFMQVGAETR